jgi:hypothetical protein
LRVPAVVMLSVSGTVDEPKYVVPAARLYA